jgi:hypothetical protein
LRGGAAWRNNGKTVWKVENLNFKINGKEIRVRSLFDSVYEKRWMKTTLITASMFTVLFIVMLAWYQILYPDFWGVLVWIIAILPQVIYWWMNYGNRYQRYIFSLELERLSQNNRAINALPLMGARHGAITTEKGR